MAVTGRDDAARADLYRALLDRPALDRAYRIATLMLGSRADAEEATHDAALHAWRRLAELRDPERFEAWFGRILVNACRDRLRSRRRRPVLLEAEPPPGREADQRFGAQPDIADVVARQQAIGGALRALSHDHREVIVLRFYAELSVEEIAARTGARPGTVKSRLHYALLQLRATLDDRSFPGGLR